MSLAPQGSLNGDNPEQCWLPRAIFLEDLYRHVQDDPHATILRDASLGLDVTREELLLDTLAFRRHLLDGLGEETRADLIAGDREVFVCVLLPSSYAFLVAFLAVLAIGAVATPLSVAVLPAEAEYFVSVCGARAVITSKDFMGTALAARQNATFDIIEAQRNPHGLPKAHEGPLRLENGSTRDGDGEKAAVLLFTSGSTGPPKGVLHSCRSLRAASEQLRGVLALGSKDVSLEYAAVHWSGGLSSMLTILMAGGCLELCSAVFSPAWFWTRVEEGDVTFILTPPALLDHLGRYFREHIETGPSHRRDSMIEGLCRVRAMLAVSAVVSPATTRFWQDLRKGSPLVSLYASTEMSYIACTDWQRQDPIPARCVGQLMLGAASNLADGDEGELALKMPSMFQRYLSPDPDVMDAVFDEQGYYKTGDLARREGLNYFILGRASQDIIRIPGWKMNSHDIEEQIALLPSIAEVMILGVHDSTLTEHVGAIIKPRSSHADTVTTTTDSTDSPTTLATLRAALTAHNLLPIYKLPTVLRVLRDEELIPSTATGKRSKALATKMYFPPDWPSLCEDVQVWEPIREKPEWMPKKAWDWAGLGEHVNYSSGY